MQPKWFQLLYEQQHGMESRRTVRGRAVASALLLHSLLEQCTHHPVQSAKLGTK